MCGICGVLLDDPGGRVEADLVRRMCDVMAYRGPDEDGYHVDGPVGLGMRRLSIIDLEHGTQPIRNERGDVHVIHNGEIYNFRELRTQLSRLGHTFATRSDTEALVHAYEQWGEQCLSRLRGMYAFAMWDAGRHELLLAVDRFGIKPLFWARVDGGLVFGSELKCVVESGLCDREVDLGALAQFFSLGFIPAPSSALRGASKLSAGHAMRWRPGGEPEIWRYWDVPVEDGSLRADDPGVRRELEERLRDAVASHLVTDVPLGVFLSGGMDSSTVVALMSEAGHKPVRTFTIGFGDPDHDESDLARSVARRFGTEHRELTVEPASAQMLADLAHHFDEPFADASLLPTYHVSKLAREHVKVALSGDGGDELFVGYTIYAGVEAARLAGVLPASARGAAARAAGRLPEGGGRRRDRIGRVAKRVRDTMLSPDEAYLSKLCPRGLADARRLLAPDLVAELDDQDGFVAVRRAWDEYDRSGRPPGLGRYVYAGLKVGLPGDMLVKVDRMSMANSLEVRVPLLDHVLGEFVTSIPVDERFRRFRLKGLMRDVMRDTLPADILKARKRGFNVPLARWFREDLAGFARDVLLGSEARAGGCLDQAAVATFLDQHLDSRDMGSGIWGLMMFELWRRQVSWPVRTRSRADG